MYKWKIVFYIIKMGKRLYSKIVIVFVYEMCMLYKINFV